MTEFREELKQFNQAMVERLEEKSEDHHGWDETQCTMKFLVDRLNDQAQEVLRGFNNSDIQKMKEEAVDVANFAFMIYDRLLEISI